MSPRHERVATPTPRIALRSDKYCDPRIGTPASLVEPAHGFPIVFKNVVGPPEFQDYVEVGGIVFVRQLQVFERVLEVALIQAAFGKKFRARFSGKRFAIPGSRRSQ